MKSQQIAIIDYGMGNLHSVSSALSHVAPHADIIVTSDDKTIANADRVIFPGVGAMRDCISEIRRLDCDKVVHATIKSGKPILSICIGMQALLSFSDENDGTECLNEIEGRVKFFGADTQFQHVSQTGPKLKVPHMGWNHVNQTKAHSMWAGIENNARFYFVHSYFVEPAQASLTYGQSHYGLTFSSVIAQDNIFAVQFHPEKSHNNGLKLLSNFVEWNGETE